MAKNILSAPVVAISDANKGGNNLPDVLSTKFKHQKQSPLLSTEQYFYKEVIPHYNLRTPKGKKPTIVYFVCCIGGRQHRISTGYKVYPTQWGKDKAIISNRQSNLDNRNNTLLNEKIDEMNERFKKYKTYLCDALIEHSNQLFKNFMNNSQNKETDIIKHIKETILKDGLAKNTKEKYLMYISRFETFLKTKETYELNTALIKEFQHWCVDNIKTQGGKKVTPNTINETVKKLMTILKKYGVAYGYIEKVTFDNILVIPLTIKRKDDNEIALRGDEVTQIHNYKCDNKTDEEIKDLFVLECLTGQRISDIPKVSDFIETKDGRTYINIIQEKTTKKVEVDIIFQIALDIIKKYNYKLPVYDRFKYNKRIKEICKAAGIKGTEIMTRQEAGKGEVEQIQKQRYECVSSHTGRRTFITLLSVMGYTYEEIARYSGHIDLNTLRRYDKSKEGTKFKSIYDDTKKKRPEILPQLIQVETEKPIIKEIVYKEARENIKISEYAIDRDIDINQYELTEDEIHFINKTADQFSVGVPSLKVKKILNRLVSLGIVVKLSE